MQEPAGGAQRRPDAALGSLLKSGFDSCSGHGRIQRRSLSPFTRSRDFFRGKTIEHTRKPASLGRGSLVKLTRAGAARRRARGLRDSVWHP